MASTSYTGPGDGNWNRGKLVNWYSSQCGGANCNNSDNNGNLRQQETFIPHNEQATSWSQQFDYDNLNRLERVKEFNSGGGQLWQQEYVYDRWGNRTIHQTNTWGPAAGPAIPKPNFGVDPANNNRLTVPGGYTMSYDGAGNVTYDNYTGQGQRSYDAENRMTQAWGNNQWQTYAYDARGQRVSRKVDGVETWLVYGMDGELVAEYPANAGVGSPQKEYGYRNGQLLVTAGAEESPNLAAGKTATQSSDEAGGVAGRAVDGNTNGNWANGSVSHTGLNAQAWWQVDLGGMKAVQSVQVWNRTDCCAERLTNFNVLLLDNTQTVVASTTVSGAAGTPTTVPVSGTARYVKVQLVGTNYLSLAEVKVWGESSGDSDIQWLVTDQLGTPRMIFDKTGALANVKRHDYLPFGEELIAYQGLRTPGLGYTGDNVRQKFTSKERDNETGLDYFLARYYSNTQGRFTSADSFAGSRSDPQSLNRYAYVQNNPLNFTDPTGHMREPWRVPSILDYLFGPRVSEPMMGQGQVQKPVNIVSGGTTSGTADDGRRFDATLVSVSELGEVIESQPNLLRRIWSRIRGIRGISAGTTLGASGGLGTGLFGAGGVGSVQSGLFYDTSSGHINAGNVASGGVVFGVHNFEGSNPNGPEFRRPRVSGESMVMGAWAGLGGGGWFSNARSVRDLAGPFQTTHVSTPWVGFQIDQGADGIMVFSATLGPSAGAGVYKSPTNAAVLWDVDKQVP